MTLVMMLSMLPTAVWARETGSGGSQETLLTLVMMLNLLPTVAWARNDEGIDADSVEMYM